MWLSCGSSHRLFHKLPSGLQYVLCPFSHTEDTPQPLLVTARSTSVGSPGRLRVSPRRSGWQPVNGKGSYQTPHAHTHRFPISDDGQGRGHPIRAEELER